MQLGIDFGGTAVKLGLVEHGALVASGTIPITQTVADLDRAATGAAALVRGAGTRVDAVGIAVPGVVTADGRGMLQANDKYAYLQRIDLIDWSARALGLPAVVENDARAALVGEVAGGCAAGARDAVGVILGTGIGTAAMMGGVLVRGAHGHAGILGGHVTIDIDAPACPCGNLGCGESLASMRALHEQLPELDGYDELITRADGSPRLAEILTHHLAVWGATVVAMCHAYDPDVVVLSGGILRAGDAVRDPIAAYVDEHLWSSAHRPRIAVPTAPELSVVRGLATLAAHDRGAGHDRGARPRGKETR